MIDVLTSALLFILRLLGFVFETARWITIFRGSGQQVSDIDKLVEVPPDPKVLPAAAKRALAEADERRGPDAA